MQGATADQSGGKAGISAKNKIGCRGPAIAEIAGCLNYSRFSSAADPPR